ncbi:acyl-CoA dehydrogenase family protein [Rhodoglobus aureus]|uniref:glutaryl-CoA dehydrogenase (ETF) n=1 Tax=Rhodoglobus aureus TaxID=191497 RepID=A0ABN1VYZ8_9MICO
MTSNSVSETLLGLDALLTEEERGWQAKARTFASQRVSPTIEKDFEDALFRREFVAELGALGMLGMHLTGYGTAGANATSYGLVCYELEAADTAWRTFVSVQGSLAMSALAYFGSDEQKERWLPSLAAGASIGCFGLTEPTGGSDPAGMLTRATRSGDDWVLNGSKRWIGLGSVADVAIIWAQTDDGVRGFVVPTDTPGFRAENIESKHSLRASIQCDLFFDNLRLPASAVLPEARGLSAPFRCLNDARYGIVWGVMGAARDCLDVAIERSKTRLAFGKPIGAMQLTQLKLADSFVEYEKGMLLSLHLAKLKDAQALTPEQISVGKLNNVREAIRIASTARSILAGDGITGDFSVMRHMNNLESVRTYEGTDEIHTLVLGRALTEQGAFR